MLALPLVLALALPANVAIQATTSASSQTNGGWVSVAPGRVARPTVSTVLTPSLSLSLAGRAFSVGASYDLRLFRRFELSNTMNQVAAIDRFLVNHSGSGSVGLQLKKGWAIGANVTVSLGELDLPSVNNALTTVNTNAGTGAGSQVGSVPASAVDPAAVTDDGVIESINLQGASNLSGQLTPVLDFRLSIRSSYRGPLSTPENLQNTTLANLVPKQTSFGIDSSFGYTLTKLDSINLSAGASWSLSPRTGDYRSVSLLVGYGRQLGPSSSVSAALGILAVSVLSPPPAMAGFAQPNDSISPALNLSYIMRLLNLRELRTSLIAGSSISSRQNPSTGVLEPRLSATLGLSSNIGSRWTVELRGVFGTSATTEPLMTTSNPMTATGQVGNLLAATETTLQIQLPVTYTFSQGFTMVGGVTYSNYGPRLADPNFSLSFPGVQAFLRISISLSQAL